MNALVPSPTTSTGGAVAAFVPQDLGQVIQLAEMITRAGWAPKHYRADVPMNAAGARVGRPDDQPFDKDKIALGIMHGMEVGLKPVQALQNIAVINGMPAIYGDAALGLVRASGLLEDFRETPIRGDRTVEGANREMVTIKDVIVGYHCWAKRKGQETPIEWTYTVDMAIKAKLWGKTGPWTDHPERMLQMRARSWTLRDGFSEVLKGLAIAEEAQDVTVTVVSPPTPPSTAGATKAATSGKAAAGSALDQFAAAPKPKAGTVEAANPEKTATEALGEGDGIADAQFTEIGSAGVSEASVGEGLDDAPAGDAGDGAPPGVPVMPDTVAAAFSEGRFTPMIQWLDANMRELDIEGRQALVDDNAERLRTCHNYSEKNAGVVSRFLTAHNVVLPLK